MRAFARFSVITALVLSLGLHWALLQTVAWTGMIVSYSLEENLSGAVAKTFDGQHPCCMCKAIQKGKSEERKRDDQQLVSKGKLDLGLVWTQAAFVFTPSHAHQFRPSKHCQAELSLRKNHHHDGCSVTNTRGRISNPPTVTTVG